MKTILIFLPDTLHLDEIGMLEGFSEEFSDCIAFYITNSRLVTSSLKSIGYCSEKTPSSDLFNSNEKSQWVHVNLTDGSINIVNEKLEHTVICILYDYEKFKYSEIICGSYEYGSQFEVLIDAIQSDRLVKNSTKRFPHQFFFHLCTLCFIIFNILSKFCDKISHLLKYSEITLHLQNNIKTTEWMFKNLKTERKINVSIGNVIVARLLDFGLGLIVIVYAIKYEEEIINFVENSAESIVQNLRQLLIFLMGSPVGLKLNYAFNKTLGSFFMYHLSLWRAFLFSMRPYLHYVFHLLIIPGSLGFTFQIALIEDFIAFSTLHFYCIYVYAARLYRIQVIGLTSLWPLFIGRKFNPLRNRVDSHQYGYHQLFIGTLGFTIFLFLWPTTFVYYSIFTILRIGLVILGRIVCNLRYVIQHLPAYVLILWVCNSVLLAGTIKLCVDDQKSEQLVIHAALLRLPLKESILGTLPGTLPTMSPIKWSLIVKNFFSGILL